MKKRGGGRESGGTKSEGRGPKEVGREACRVNINTSLSLGRGKQIDSYG